MSTPATSGVVLDKLDFEGLRVAAQKQIPPLDLVRSPKGNVLKYRLVYFGTDREPPQARFRTLQEVAEYLVYQTSM